jgi:putative transposase
LTKVKKKTQTKFNMKFRSKKQPTQTITVLKKSWRKNRWWPTYWGSSNYVTGTEPIPEEWDADCNVEVRGDSQAPEPSIISLDPGVRTFMTGYDVNGRVVEWSPKDISKLYRLLKCLDKMQSMAALKSTRHRKRYRLRKAMVRQRRRIRHLVDEMHKKCAKWLCENYHGILLPEFNSSEMVKRGRRRLGNKSVRKMLTWSHYRFKQRLLAKAREYPWVKVIIVTEEFTSKTCGCCGSINIKLGGSKVFRCRDCKMILDRDVNGARNIWLKWMTELRARCEAVGLDFNLRDFIEDDDKMILDLSPEDLTLLSLMGLPSGDKYAH